MEFSTTKITPNDNVKIPSINGDNAGYMETDELKEYVGDGLITQSITDGDTTHSPSGDAVNGALNAITARLDHVNIDWADVFPNFSIDTSATRYLYAENGMLHCYASLIKSEALLSTTVGNGTAIGDHALTGNYNLFPRCTVYCDDNSGRSLIGLDINNYGSIRTYVIGDTSNATRTGVSAILAFKLDIPVSALSSTVRTKYNI